MRLHALEVEHFGPLRSASLQFGPGLNVLYGPNDLGKSHLAESIRAALLLPPSSTVHEAYVPWGTDHTPTVSLTLSVDDTHRWRVSKEFGAGSRGLALLERARGDGPFSEEAKAREVETRLRALLQWGLQPAGAAGGKRGALPESYLSRLLLGKQSEVTAIFSASLTEDPDASGKKQLTSALQALAQDPLFRRVLDRTQLRVDQAFSAGGGLRRAKDSPLVRVREEVKAAEQRVELLRQQAQGGAGLQQQLPQLLAERSALAARLVEAQAYLARARESNERARLGRVAAERLAAARRVDDEGRAAHDAVTARTAELEARRAALVTAEADHARARALLGDAEAAVRAADDRLKTVTAERAGAVQLRRQTLETRRVELESARAGAARQVEAARRTGALATDAAARQRELDAAAAEVLALEADLAKKAAAAAYEAARAEEARGQALVAAARDAAAQHATRRLALERADAALAAATTALEEAEAAAELAREQARRVQSEAGAQQRALKDEELARRTLEATAARERAEADGRRARDARAASERTAALARDHEARRTDERTAADAVGAAAAMSEAAEREVDRLALVQAYMDLRAATGQRDEAERAAAEATKLRDEAAGLRARAAALSAAQAALALPELEVLAPFRALERELGVAEAKLEVGLSVSITARRPFELRESVDGGPVEVTAADAGEELECVARRRLQLVLGDLAELTIQGGRPEDQQVATDLRARWRSEVEPVLLAAGAKDLAALEARLRDVVEQRRQVETLGQQAAALDAQQGRLADAPARLERARRAADERLAALAGREPAALEKEAAGLGLLAPAGPLFSKGAAAPVSLDARRKAAEAQVATGRKALETARVALGQAALRAETAARDLAQARDAEAAARAGLDGSPEDALARADAATKAAARALAAIEDERASLAKEQTTALADAQKKVEGAEGARAKTRQARDAAQAARDRAQTELSTSAAQLDVKTQATAGLDLPALERRAAELRDALARAGGVAAASALGEADLARLQAAVATATSSLSTARAAVAGRQASRDAAVATRDRARADLGADLEGALTAAEREQGRATTELAAVVAELASLDQHRDVAIEAARAEVTAATARLAQARAADQASARARDDARTGVDTSQGTLATLRDVARLHDRAAAQAVVARCQADVSALPAPDATVAHDDAAVRAAEQTARDAALQLEQGNLAVNRLQGQLEITGGAVIQERIKDAGDAVVRLKKGEAELELDYNAWWLLKETLVAAESQQQAHLGEKLAGPVTKRFRELTRSRYGSLALGPDLEAAGITVAGALREVDRLSIGTRDQLAALLRLTVATELRAALVLDDQLAQSDPKRLGWFSGLLRELAKTVQVVVLTCRPEDYLAPRERPEGASVMRDVDGFVRAIDLERAVRRST